MKKLPADMKNKRHKVNKSMKASYLDIVNACFVCHNQVRDKKHLKMKK